MPLGWERINNKRSTPNKNIVFIKPLPGPYENVSKDFLERIAAQCLPIMNSHHLAVVSLEEYEPNLEFWGRNFNNGEVIQLVLRSPSTGKWLPFKFVQMVMMHELAHNKQMNHSQAFWKVRNEFSTEMRVLWDKGYTGDGMWGRGLLLENGLFSRDSLEDGEVLPEHMCGGTFRSRGTKKRKVKPKITYREQQERRIRKKFGINGMALGANDETKAKLEKGKRSVAKPRVAASARGRELRAAAALARFKAKEDELAVKDEDLITDSETESDMDDNVVIKSEPNDALDINGTPLLDRKGQGMVKVCDDEDKDEENVKMELLELQGIHRQAQPVPSSKLNSTGKLVSTPKVAPSPKQHLKSAKASHQRPSTSTSANGENIESKNDTSTTATGGAIQPLMLEREGICPICSVENDATALTCMVCSNVLKPAFVANSWGCSSSTCKGGQYINAGDVGICGVCGTRKCSNGI